MTSSESMGGRGLRAAQPLIGVLVPYLSDPYTQSLIQGADAEAAAADANLIVYVLDASDSGSDGGDPYAWVDPELLDGVVLSPSLPYLDANAQARLEAFLRRCGDTPVESVALDIDGIRSVSADGYTGMRAAVEHLLDHHGLSRVAFVKGPPASPEASERYRGYVDALLAQGLSVDDALVAAGDFSTEAGAAAAAELLDRDTDLEAIVCADDDTAAGVLRTLQSRGVRVPDQVAVVGFDDAEMAETLTPPLTTVRQPVHQLGRAAVRDLLAAVQAQDVAPTPPVATDLIIRRSCGCLPGHIPVQALSQETAPKRLVTYEDYRPEIVAALEDVGGLSWALDDVVDALWRDLKASDTSEFANRVAERLYQATSSGSDVRVWHGILSRLREMIVPLLGERRLWHRAEGLLQQARSLVDEARIHAVARRQTQLAQQREAVLAFGAELANAMDPDDVVAAIAQSLPVLNVRHCYVSAYDSGLAEGARLLVSYSGGRGRAHASGAPVALGELMPGDAWRALPERFTVLAAPLYLGARSLGVVVFEGDLGNLETYRWLRQSLSGVIFRQELSEAQRDARRLAERATAEAELALRDALVAQRRQIEGSWEAYGASITGYAWSSEEGVHRSDEWLAVMTDAAQESRLVIQDDASPGPEVTQSLGLPLKLLDEEIIGVLGFVREGGAQWTSDQLIQVVTIAHELSQLLETRRLVSDVEKRAARLSAAADVSTAATSVTEIGELLTSSVNLIRERFGLTYTGIFLADDSRDWAVLVAGTGAAGQAMLARGHRLRIDEHSMIGYCIANADARVTVDTALDDVWHPNPLLPDIRSEMALPLISRAEVIGAMSIQDNRPGAFQQEDVTTLQTMANQLANAIQNARLIERMEENLREVRMATGQFTESAWQDYVSAGPGAMGYRHRLIGTARAIDRRPEAEEALQRGESVLAQLDVDDTDAQGARAGLGVPIRLRNQTLGVLNLRFEDDYVPAETVQLVQQVADRLAVSLETARLLEVTQRSAQRERLVGELSRRIRQSLEVDEVLQESVREIRSAMDLYRVSLRLAPQVSEDQQLAADGDGPAGGLSDPTTGNGNG